MDIEAMSAKGTDIPLTSLKKIYQQDLVFGQLGKQVVNQYMHDDMYNSVKLWEGMIGGTAENGKSYDIIGMLKRNGTATEVSTPYQKASIQGRSLAIVPNPNLLAWLTKHSDANGNISEGVVNPHLQYKLAPDGKTVYLMHTGAVNAIPTKIHENK
jgi:hypothetical protein